MLISTQLWPETPVLPKHQAVLDCVNVSHLKEELSASHNFCFYPYCLFAIKNGDQTRQSDEMKMISDDVTNKMQRKLLQLSSFSFPSQKSIFLTFPVTDDVNQHL